MSFVTCASELRGKPKREFNRLLRQAERGRIGRDDTKVDHALKMHLFVPDGMLGWDGLGLGLIGSHVDSRTAPTTTMLVRSGIAKWLGCRPKRERLPD